MAHMARGAAIIMEDELWCSIIFLLVRQKYVYDSKGV